MTTNLLIICHTEIIVVVVNPAGILCQGRYIPGTKNIVADTKVGTWLKTPLSSIKQSVLRPQASNLLPKLFFSWCIHSVHACFIKVSLVLAAVKISDCLDKFDILTLVKLGRGKLKKEYIF